MAFTNKKEDEYIPPKIKKHLAAQILASNNHLKTMLSFLEHRAVQYRLRSDIEK